MGLMPLPDQPTFTPLPAARTLRVIVNRRAGRVLQMGQEGFARLVRSHLSVGDATVDIRFLPARRLHEGLREALASPVDLVVLAGGDGTISHALPLLLEARRPVGILPLGTLNLLGSDLGLKGDIVSDIEALAHGAPRRISLARVNGRLFHSVAGFGVMSLMARERENARRAIPFSRTLGFVAAAAKTLLTYRPIDVEFEDAGAQRLLKADTVLVTANRFEGVPWRRPRLDTGRLEVHVLAAGGLMTRLRLLWLMLHGRWREHPGLTSFSTTRFVVRRRRKNSIALSVDGEPCRLHGPVEFDIAPQELCLHA